MNDNNIPLNIPDGKHPVETGKYLIATNEIDRLCYIVSNWIENRFPGAIIYGRPRLGKTRAISYLLKVLPEELNENIPFFHIRCRSYRSSRENSFFEDLLNGVGHSLASDGRTSEKRERLKNFLISEAEKSKQNKIVFFIDDAQKLKDMEYDWLMDVYNELDEHSIILTTILVGHEELINQRKRFIKKKELQIIGRFMSDSYLFSGLKNLDDFKTLIEEYDTGTEFPHDSEISYTKYFFRDDFAPNFMLSNYAEDIFNEFRLVQIEKGLPVEKEIPMQYAVLTIEFVLKKYGFKGERLNGLSKQHIRMAIMSSGYIQSELVLIDLD
ncbi:AAA family ATPase [Lysinibacillus xylanilyticus]|uniref:AAA family ATPase n=1 Tax=Lysinibacillus xylanilyticus TaxID=582475 RepID=UPI00382C3888